MADLTTLENAKQYLGLTVTTDDALVTRLVGAASAWIRSFLNRDVLVDTYQDILDGTGTPSIQVAQYPITGLVSVTVDGLAVALSSLAARGAFIHRTDGQKWPVGFANVVVDYTAGYAAVPADIEQACIEIVAWRYKEKDRIGHASKTIGQEVITFQTQDIPNSAKTLLNNWRRVIP